MAQQQINKITSQDDKEIELVLPKVLRGSMEDEYQTPFRLHGNFGKEPLNKLTSKILK